MIKFNIKHILLLLLVLLLIYITYDNCNCRIERFNISITNLEEGNQKLAQLNLTTDYQNLNEVRVMSADGNEILNYSVGQNPGDFAYWTVN